jgi:hypothetical protein
MRFEIFDGLSRGGSMGSSMGRDLGGVCSMG